LLADASPNASIRDSKSEYLRRNTSASAFDSARLAVNALSDSCRIDNCLRKSSFCASSDSAVIFCSALSILDSDKELFPSAASPRASVMQPNTAKKILNYLVTFAVCEPCFLKIRVAENSPSL
jgi:hypothetical protein